MGRTFQLYTRIRERRLFRIFVSYLAGGWVVLGVADQLIDRGFLPEAVFHVGLIWYLVGVPACLLIGWHHGEKGRQKAPASELAALAGLAVAGVALSVSPVSRHFSTVQRAAAAESGLDLRRLAVMYFDDLTRGGEERHLADGLTEDLIAELGRVNALDVVSRNGVAPFRGVEALPDSVAGLLGVGTLVDGSVERVGDRVRVNLRLIDGTSGAEFRRASFERPAADALEIRGELVDETARFLRDWLGDEVRVRGMADDTDSPAAWALVQRAEKSRKDAEALLERGDLAGMDRAFRAADALLERAETLDPDWVRPVVLRGTLAYRRSRAAAEPADAVRWIGEGMRHAERALGRSPRDAPALELRGTLRYWHHLLHATPDPAAQAALLAGARADLERAVEIDPSLASAHSTLSHLYYQEDDVPAVVLAARRAYEEDAYLDVADQVLWRLFTGSYDLEQFTQARRWCDEGGRRFSGDYRFAECQLLVMTTPAVQPDPGRAWRLVDRLATLTPEPRRAHELTRGRILVAGILGRAGMGDSARAVLLRTRGEAGYAADPTRELLLLEAHVRTTLGDEDAAIDVLRRYAAATPGYGFDHYWWWHPLRGHPRFRELSGQGGHGGGHAH